MFYLVLSRDDFGDYHATEFETYEKAIEFYHTPSNVIFPYKIVTINSKGEIIGD